MLITKVWRPWSCGPVPSQETEQVSHIFIHMGFIRLTGGFCRLLPCLGIGPVSRPCDLNPKLFRGMAYKRGKTLPLRANPVHFFFAKKVHVLCGSVLAYSKPLG